MKLGNLKYPIPAVYTYKKSFSDTIKHQDCHILNVVVSKKKELRSTTSVYRMARAVISFDDTGGLDVVGLNSLAIKTPPQCN